MTDHGDETFVASGNTVSLWRRGKLHTTYPPFSGSVVTLMMFGDQLLAVTDDNAVTVIDTFTGGSPALACVRVCALGCFGLYALGWIACVLWVAWLRAC